jgi:hypothetical protein
VCPDWGPRQESFDLEDIWLRAGALTTRRRLFTGDFYPLTDYSIRVTDWIGYQFHRGDLGEGLALSFRREASEQETLEFSLRGLAPDVLKELRFEKSGETQATNGKELSRRCRG